MTQMLKNSMNIPINYNEVKIYNLFLTIDNLLYLIMIFVSFFFIFFTVRINYQLLKSSSVLLSYLWVVTQIATKCLPHVNLFKYNHRALYLIKLICK